MPPPSLSARLRLTRVGLHLVYGGMQVALLFPFVGLRGRDRLKQRWSRSLLAILRIRIDPPDHALDRLGGGLLVANHVSFMDIFVINALLPSGFVAKSDVSGWPLIGWLSRRNETVFIERGKRKAAHLTQERMLAVLAGGRRLVVFPEGTTTAGAEVLPFHGALFQSAIDAAVPVHALAIQYVDAQGRPSAAPAYIGELSVADCLRNILASGGLRATLRLAESFRPPLPDRRHLAHRAHQAIAASLRQHPGDELSQPCRNATAISP